MRSFKIYAGILTVLLVLYVIAQANKPKPVNWQTTLRYDDKIPFGTYIFYHELPTLFHVANIERTNKTLSQLFNDTTLSKGTYIIIAKNININKADLQGLFKFISAGNTVFMSGNEWDGKLVDTLHLDMAAELEKNVAVNFTSQSLKRGDNYHFDNTLLTQYFKGFDTAHVTSLSRTGEGHTNLLRYNKGKGSLYLMASPYLLTNYGMLKNDGAEYVAKALSYLPETAHIYWDQFQNHDIDEDISPMRVILNNEALRTAYYLSLIVLVVYVIYQAKRRQRVIPVILPLKNATVDFVTTVGRVYYEQRDNSNIVVKKINHLFDYMRSVLHLKVDLTDREFAPTLARKTGLEPSFINELLGQIMYTMNQSRISDAELVRLNDLIEYFYAQTQ